MTGFSVNLPYLLTYASVQTTPSPCAWVGGHEAKPPTDVHDRAGMGSGAQDGAWRSDLWEIVLVRGFPHARGPVGVKHGACFGRAQ